MSSLNYLMKYGRAMKKRRNTVAALEQCPQRRGVCIRLYIVPPKKPHSAKRKVARLGLSNMYYIICYIPGEGHNLHQYSMVLVRGGRVKDLPGIKYKMIRGAMDLQGILKRSNARSKYGTKHWVMRRIPRLKMRKF
jgi:small subunit ribosomal protein S12